MQFYKSKHKILSLLLAVMLVCTLLPAVPAAAAPAEDFDQTFDLADGSINVSGNTGDILITGTYTGEPEGNPYVIFVQNSFIGTVTLRDVTVDLSLSAGGYALTVGNSNDYTGTTVYLEGDNTFTGAPGSPAVMNIRNSKISGRTGASLSVIGASAVISGSTVENLALTVNAGSSSSALSLNDSKLVDCVTVLNNTNTSDNNPNSLAIANGALASNGNDEISGGTLEATGRYGIWAGGGIIGASHLTISAGAKVTANGSGGDGVYLQGGALTVAGELEAVAEVGAGADSGKRGNGIAAMSYFGASSIYVAAGGKIVARGSDERTTYASTGSGHGIYTANNTTTSEVTENAVISVDGTLEAYAAKGHGIYLHGTDIHAGAEGKLLSRGGSSSGFGIFAYNAYKGGGAAANSYRDIITGWTREPGSVVQAFPGPDTSPEYPCAMQFANGDDPHILEVDFTDGPQTPVITIEAQPADTAVTEGNITGALSVSAGVTEGASLSYQWYKNTSDTNTGGTPVEGAAAASFTLPSTLTVAGSPYYYYVAVSATGGAVPVSSEAATVTVSTKPAVAAPKDAFWGEGDDAGVAVFGGNTDGELANIDCYSVQLYKCETAVGAPQTITKDAPGFRYDFNSLIEDNGTGSYTFKVTSKAAPDDPDWADSAEVTSAPYAFVATLPAPAGLTFSEAGVAAWAAVPGAADYTVELLRDGVSLDPAVTAGVAVNSYDFLAAMKAAGGGNYSFTVTANGNADNSDYMDSPAAVSAGAEGTFTMRGIDADAVLAEAILVKGDPADGILPATVDFGAVTGVKVVWNGTLNTGAAGKFAFEGTPVNLPDDVSAGSKKAALTVYVLDVTTDKDKLYLYLAADGAGNTGTISAALLPAAYAEAGSYQWSVTPPDNVAVGNSTAEKAVFTASGTGNATAMVTVTVGGKTLTKTAEIIITENALAQLDPPGNPSFDTEGKAVWDAVNEAGGYGVGYYRDGAPFGEVKETAAGTTAHDYFYAIRDAGAGSYTFAVTARGDDVTTMDSPAAVSGAFVIESVVSVAAPAAVTNVPVGTAQASAGLPAMVTAALSGGGTAFLPVTWSGWDSSAAKTVTMTGTLGALPNNVVNTGNIAVPSLSVTFVAGSGGSDEDGGGGSGTPPAGGGGTTTPAATARPPVDINGGNFNAAAKANGGVDIVLTAADVTGNLGGGNELTVTVADTDDVTLSLPVSALGGASLRVIADFGTAYFPASILQSLQGKYGDTLRVSLRRGSFVVELLANGKPVAYDDPANPFTVTLPYTLASGQSAGAVVAVKKEGGSADNGSTDAVTILPLAVYKNGTATFDITATGTYDLIYNAKAFGDITGHWAADTVAFTSARGLFAGTGGNSFSPDTPVTCAMFVAVLSRLDGADLSGYTSQRFSGVPAGKWYSAAAEWAAENGIAGGPEDGAFNPDAAITREQMAVMLTRYMAAKEINIALTQQYAVFADGAEISAGAGSAVQTVNKTGIMNGKPGNRFDPKGAATRAEAASVFARFVEAVAE